MLIEGSVFSLHKRVFPTQKMAACQIVIVLLLGFYLQFCDCSRQIRAAAEQQNITEDHRPVKDSYTPPGGPANHHEMAGVAESFTRLADEMVEEKPKSELPLSGKHKQLNMKLKGAHKLQNDFSNSSSKKFMVVPWHKLPAKEYDHGPAFHVDYSAPKTHPPKNN